MSWPDDKKPRFVIASVSGYPIRASRGTAGNASLQTSYQVVDRAYACAVVREFGPDGTRGPYRDAMRHTQAQALANQLNASDRAGLMEERQESDAA